MPDVIDEQDHTASLQDGRMPMKLLRYDVSRDQSETPRGLPIPLVGARQVHDEWVWPTSALDHMEDLRDSGA